MKERFLNRIEVTKIRNIELRILRRENRVHPRIV